MMNRRLTQEEFDEIESVFQKATTAYTKADAEPFMNRLGFLSNGLSYEIAGNVRNMVSELVSATSSATGQVRDKAHWLSSAEQLLYKLHSFGVEEEKSE